MSSDLSVNSNPFRWPDSPPALAQDLVATVVHYEEVPDECTIHPLEASDEELVTCWISAQEGAYVALPDAV